MPRKSPVRWTQHEETLIAIEVERMRENLDARENRSGNGHFARKLVAQVCIAQRVLEPARRKTYGGIYSMQALDDGWLRSALARRATYGMTADPEPAPPPPPIDPATVKRNALALAFGSQILDLIEAAVDAAVSRALAALPHPVAQAAAAAAPAPLTPTAPRRRIDIVGLKGNQRDAVQHSDIAKSFDIRFLGADCHLRKRELRDEVILMRKFVSHSDQGRYRQMGATLHWANGGVSSVIRLLEEMRRHRGNGVTAH